MNTTAKLVRSLWSLCNVLRDDGISYQDYLAELSHLLFLKTAADRELEARLPREATWTYLSTSPKAEQLDRYRHALQLLGNSDDTVVRSIFEGAVTQMRSPIAFSRLLQAMNALPWTLDTPAGMGDVYEGLVEKNATESRYGAGQYFTPRPLVEALSTVLSPGSNDRVYDPAAGTAGFLVSAGTHALAGGQQCELIGVELVPGVRRMAEMNAYLHNLRISLQSRDSLSRHPSEIGATVCLTNPPFGTKGSSAETLSSEIPFPTNNKQLAFLQHVALSLAPNGRAAIVLPDNVLFEEGAAKSVRTWLLDNFDLHTILRLPRGIFYATGVRTSVAVFSSARPTSETWIYDLRDPDETFTKNRKLRHEHLEPFVAAFGPDPFGHASRSATPAWRSFEREEIRQLGDRLDISPINVLPRPLGSPETTLDLILSELEDAVNSVRDMQTLLNDGAL